jgi:hypothetical protein
MCTGEEKIDMSFCERECNKEFGAEIWSRDLEQTGGISELGNGE